MKVPLALASCLTNECHHSWNHEAHVLRKTHLRYQKINSKHNSILKVFIINHIILGDPLQKN